MLVDNYVNMVGEHFLFFMHKQLTMRYIIFFLLFFLAGCIVSKPFNKACNANSGKTWRINNNTLTVNGKSFTIDRLIDWQDRIEDELPNSYLVYTGNKMFVLYVDSIGVEVKTIFFTK